MRDHCPVCANDQFSPYLTRTFETFSTQLVLCSYCGFMFYKPSAPEWLQDRQSSPPSEDALDWADFRKERLALGMKTGVLSSVIAPGKRVLELGCGMGLFLHQLTRQGLQVTGVEATRKKVDLARQLFGLRVFNGTAREYIELNSEEKFDLILANELVDKDLDFRSFLRHIRSLLTETGVLSIQSFDVSRLAPGDAGRSFLHMLPLNRHNFFNTDTLKYVLESEGFSVQFNAAFNQLGLHFLAVPAAFRSVYQPIRKADTDALRTRLSVMEKQIELTRQIQSALDTEQVKTILYHPSFYQFVPYYLKAAILRVLFKRNLHELAGRLMAYDLDSEKRRVVRHAILAQWYFGENKDMAALSHIDQIPDWYPDVHVWEIGFQIAVRNQEKGLITRYANRLISGWPFQWDMLRELSNMTPIIPLVFFRRIFQKINTEFQQYKGVLDFFTMFNDPQVKTVLNFFRNFFETQDVRAESQMIAAWLDFADPEQGTASTIFGDS